VDSSAEQQILQGMPDGHGGWCPPSHIGNQPVCGVIEHLTMSSDGRRLLLSVYRTELPNLVEESVDLYVLGIDGSGLRLVHHEPSGKFDFALAPDGHRLAYTAGLPQTDGTRMGILDVDSGEEIALPDGGLPMLWSPDSERVAYHVETDPASSDETWVGDASGDNPRRLGNYHALAWTADSRALFVTERIGVPYDPPELVAIDDPSPPVHRWDVGATDELAPSPDGRKVAIVQTTDRPGQLRIVLVGRNGSDPVALAPFKADHARLCWSADGRWLFWLATHDQSVQAEFSAYDVVDNTTRLLAHAHTTSERAIYAPGCG
jgi:Tol biopolymer transport system component